MGSESERGGASPTVEDGTTGAGTQPAASESWEKLDIDQVRRGDTGWVSRHLAGTRILPLAGALAGVAVLGAVARVVKGFISRRGR